MTLLRTFCMCRNIHEGKSCEYVLQNFQTSEDSVHTFRVAAVNDVGKGPYSMPVCLTKTEACMYPFVSTSCMVLVRINVEWTNWGPPHNLFYRAVMFA